MAAISESVTLCAQSVGARRIAPINFLGSVTTVFNIQYGLHTSSMAQSLGARSENSTDKCLSICDYYIPINERKGDFQGATPVHTYFPLN